MYYTPTISSASHESGTYGRNADLDKSDAGIGIVVLGSRTHDDDGFAGDRLAVTLDIGGVTEIHTFDARTLKPAEKMNFVSEP